MKYLILFTAVSMFAMGALYAQSNIIISGDNTATYIYRTEKDVLNNYFENQFRLRLDQRIFSFGMTFRAELPRYDNVEPVNKLHPEDIHTEWDERFVQLNYDNFRLKAGTIEEAFGVGIVLRAWNDEENYIDKRLEGAQVQYTFGDLKLSGVYGAFRKGDEDIMFGNNPRYSKNDLVVGGDIEYRPLPFMSVGLSAVEFKKQTELIWANYDGYTRFNTFGGRLGLSTDLFDLNAEYSELRRLRDFTDRTTGSAIYSTGNVYLGPVTVGGGYKRYSRYFLHTSEYTDIWGFTNDYTYYYPLADMPTLNHYDELISSYADAVFEEGFMGEMRFIPDFDNEFLISYSEAWDRDKNVNHQNIFTEYKRNFETFSVKLDLEYLDKSKEYHHEMASSREGEMRIEPSIFFDFYELMIPLGFTFSWEYTEEDSYYESQTYFLDKTDITNKPYVQIDGKLTDWLSVAIFASTEFSKPSDFMKSKVYLGGEIVNNIMNHTELKLFVGKEQGGKVCRNGVCTEQPYFEGVKLTLSTRF